MDRAGGFIFSAISYAVKSVAKDRFDLHVVERFFDLRLCHRLIEEIRRAANSTALIFGKQDSGVVDERARKVNRAELDAKTVIEVTTRLVNYLPQLRDYFEVPLGAIEDPQFLWYRPGDFFVAHQDGNTKMVNLESDRLRRVSVSIFLNGQDENESPNCYEGGALVFSDRVNENRSVVHGDAGKLVAFRSELTHEVTPVKNGDRFAIVTWCRIGG
jgi:predicted 2-oxoglutarate/Fe(II)-dependent dioxygenase YbiX